MLKYIIFIVVAVIVVAGVVMYRNGSQQASAPTAPADATGAIAPVAAPAATGTPITNSKPVTMQNGLIIEDVKVGTGETAVKGALITVHYVGTLDNGTKFDSSRDRGEPFQFPLGQGMVIQGWEQGFEGMKIGGVRKLTIPPSLGYGAQGAGGVIPPNATLHFEVELLGVRLK